MVADHVVQRRVVFPAAGYLEVARAASVYGAASRGQPPNARESSPQVGALDQAVFLSPLVADASAEIAMEVALFGNEQLEIRSGAWDGAQVKPHQLDRSGDRARREAPTL